MSWIDYTILMVIGFSCLVSLSRGFFREVLSLIIWSFAIFVSTHYYSCLSSWITYFENKLVRDCVSIVVEFVLIVILGAIINNFMGQFIEKILLLEILDRVLGICFGVLRGVFIVAIILFFLDIFTELSSSMIWKESKFISHFNFIIKWFFSYLQYISSFLTKTYLCFSKNLIFL